MRHYRKVLLTHANLKKPLHVVAGTIAGYHHSDATQSTHLYTTGGIFPVVETPEQIDQIIESLNMPAGQGAVNEQQWTAVRQASNLRKRKKNSNGG